MRKIIGIVGQPEYSIHADAAMARLGATESLGSLEGAARRSLFPSLKSGLVTETHVRKVANKLGVQIPVQKYAGKQVASQAEADDHFLSIARQYGGPAWEAEYYLDTDFFRKPRGVYSAMVESPASSAKLKSRMGDDYVEVVVLAPDEQAPRRARYTLLAPGDDQAEFEGRVRDLLARIKKDMKEKKA